VCRRSIDEGGDLFLPPGTVATVVRALYGDPQAQPSVVRGKSGRTEVHSPWVDVTSSVRQMLVEQGLPRVPVAEAFAPFLRAHARPSAAAAAGERSD